MAGVMTIEMLNGQAAHIPIQPRPLAAYPDQADHGGPEGSDLVPYRHEMLPPNMPDAFGYERRHPTPGEIHIAPDQNGMRMPSKPITPSMNPRMFPREGNLPYSDERVPTESYRTRQETFDRNMDYWAAKPVMGPDDWPAKILWPYNPTQQMVDRIEHDVLPIPGSSRRTVPEGSVVDIDLETARDMWGDKRMDAQLDGYGMGDLGAVPSDAMIGAATQAAVQAVIDTTKANPTEAAKPGFIETAINTAASLTAQILAMKTAQAQAEAAKAQADAQAAAKLRAQQAVAGGGGYTADEPFYTKPVFLGGAAILLLGIGYMALRKK